MDNKINEVLFEMHQSLLLADHLGDVAELSGRILELEELIAAAQRDPAQLDGFDPDGINQGYRDEGWVWCEDEGRWRSPDEDFGVDDE